MKWILPAAILIGIVSVCLIGAVLARRICSALGLIRTISSHMDDNILEEAQAPRSVSSAENTLEPYIRRDFPEYNSAVIHARVKKDALSFYESARQGVILFDETEATKGFLAALPQKLPDDVSGDILIHIAALKAYDTRGRDKLLTFQAAAEYVTHAGNKSQKRLTLIYICATLSDPEKGYMALSCPKCGAPMPAYGSRVCAYCGTALAVSAGYGWMLIDAYED